MEFYAAPDFQERNAGGAGLDGGAGQGVKILRGVLIVVFGFYPIGAAGGAVSKVTFDTFIRLHQKLNRLEQAVRRYIFFAKNLYTF